MKSALRWAAEVEGLNASARSALTCLAKHYNHKNRRCFPSYQTIAEFVGCTTRHAIRLLQQLRDIGLISWVARFAKRGSQTSNEYALLMECHAEGDSDVTPITLNNDLKETPSGQDEKSVRIDWWNRLTLYLGGTGHRWPVAAWGARPGDSGCEVPERVLAAFRAKYSRYLQRNPVVGL